MSDTRKGAKSPLYTSKRRELEKREALVAHAQRSGEVTNHGRDRDGAYRIKNRLDTTSE